MRIESLQREFLPSDSLAPEDFFVLLAFATGKDKAFLLGHPEYELSEKTLTRAKNFFIRRQKHEPVAYITGQKEFYGRAFRVTPATLIPRPETETLVEHAFDRIKNLESRITGKKEKIDIIDIGTGSGNIITSLAKETSLLIPHHSRLSFYGIDISPEALMVAQENAKTHEMEEKITFLRGDLFHPYTEKYLSTDTHLLLTANLPYLSEALYATTAEDVRNYEPKSALYSDEAGLSHYLRLLQMISTHKKDFLSLILFLEISPEQSIPLREGIRSLFPKASVKIHLDLAQRERVVEIRLL